MAGSAPYQAGFIIIFFPSHPKSGGKILGNEKTQASSVSAKATYKTS